jgi:hypothetical protein
MGDAGSQTFPPSDRNPAEIVAWIRNSRICSALVRLLVVVEGLGFLSDARDDEEEICRGGRGPIGRNPLGYNTP